MVSILASAFVSSYITCTNCNGIGYFEIDCPRCSGSGVITKRVKKSFARSVAVKDVSIYVDEEVSCPACLRGMSSKGKKGTGKKKVTCKTCHGQKKIKAPKLLK